jgi:sugar lactone lactonase YvrE
VADERGNAYVNSIGFDFPGGQFAPGLIALVTPDGAAREVTDGLAFPNGMVISPDGATLIVAESGGNRLTAYDIGRDGGLGGRRTWADTPGDHPDGICADSEGAVWYADVASGRCVRVRDVVGDHQSGRVAGGGWPSWLPTPRWHRRSAAGAAGRCRTVRLPAAPGIR